MGRDFVTQVSDRLVTQTVQNAGALPSVAAFDVLANKTIILMATDCLVVMSYTGLSYLDKTPTDQWLAEQCWQDSVSLPGGEVIGFMRRSGRRPLHLGPLLGGLQEKLTAAYTRLPHPWRVEPLAISIGGWQWTRKKRPRPILVSVEKGRGKQAFEVRRLVPRHLGRTSVLAVSPLGHLNALEIEALAHSADLDHPGTTENRFIAEIRKVSLRTDSVGADCMSVTLLHPWSWQIVLRYDPYLPGTERPKAAYTPWLVGSNVLVGPARVRGTVTGRFLSAAGYDVSLHAPMEFDPGVLWGFVAQRRPPSP